MKKQITNVYFPLSVLSLAIAVAGKAYAQEESIAQAPQLDYQSQQAMEEVVTLGRLRDSAAQLVIERLEQEVVTDVLGAEAIGRIGDSTVGAALRRVPGVTLVDGKFVYVRGLGERYSSTFLNGAVVPSPDLTRNVIPLDIFPTSIVDSLSVQKSYSADTAAAFGGGSVNVRTKGIPDAFTYSLEIGTGFDSESTGDVRTYAGGGDDWMGTDDGTRAMPSEIVAALQTYKGTLGSTNTSINRDLALSLNRNVELQEKSYSPDTSFKGNIGNNFLFDNGMEFGFLTGITYKNSWKNANSESHSDTSAELYDEIVSFKEKSTYSVNATANVNLGFRLNDENLISTTSLFIRNTDDDVSLIKSFNNNQPLSGGAGALSQELKYEERSMTVNQINGQHEFGSETRDLLGLNALAFLDGAKLDWFYSKARARTDIPGEWTISSDITVNPATVDVLDSSVRSVNSAADIRYTDLEDEVESYGWTVKYPISLAKAEIELSGGYAYSRKARSYKETQLLLGTTDRNEFLAQGVNAAFGDEAIADAGNRYAVGVFGGNAQSYLAGNTLSSTFGMFDVTYDETWRFSAGLRYEDFTQLALGWDPLDYNGKDGTVQGISTDPDQLQALVFQEDAFYPSASLVYMHPGFWAEDFQLRFGYSETVIRPDLREVSNSSYVDPITGFKVFGNSNLVTSAVKNYDVRAEWFFDDGDNLTVSLFYKDIADPIEFFETAASDSDIAYEILNADSSTLNGLEVEFLKNLGSYSDALSQFYLAGNFTLQDTELTAGANADAPTNPVRQLNSAADYTANLQLGFDADNGKHSATLVYNVAGERLYIAGRNQDPDVFEQPFNSVDLTYSYYPTDAFTLKLKLQNLLDENVVLERRNTPIYEKEVGIGASLAVQYTY